MALGDGIRNAIDRGTPFLNTVVGKGQELTGNFNQNRSDFRENNPGAKLLKPIVKIGAGLAVGAKLLKNKKKEGSFFPKIRDSLQENIGNPLNMAHDKWLNSPEKAKWDKYLETGQIPPEGLFPRFPKVNEKFGGPPAGGDETDPLITLNDDDFEIEGSDLDPESEEFENSPAGTASGAINQLENNASFTQSTFTSIVNDLLPRNEDGSLKRDGLDEALGQTMTDAAVGKLDPASSEYLKNYEKLIDRQVSDQIRITKENAGASRGLSSGGTANMIADVIAEGGDKKMLELARVQRENLSKAISFLATDKQFTSTMTSIASNLASSIGATQANASGMILDFIMDGVEVSMEKAQLQFDIDKENMDIIQAETTMWDNFINGLISLAFPKISGASQLFAAPTSSRTGNQPEGNPLTEPDNPDPTPSPRPTPGPGGNGAFLNPSRTRGFDTSTEQGAKDFRNSFL